MAWWDDLGNAVISGTQAVGDFVEAVVETVTDTVENAVDAAINTAEEGVDIAVDWIVGLKIGGESAINLAGLAMLLGGVINSVLSTVREVVAGVLHIVKGVGRLVGSVLRLNLPGFVQALLDILIGVGEIVVAAIRVVTLGATIGKIVDAYHRAELKTFVEELLSDNFSDKRLENVRSRLNMDSPRWGLTCDVMHAVFVMDSSKGFPLAQLHNDRDIDLFAASGTLSLTTLPMFRDRFTFKALSSDGSEHWFPANRNDIISFLATGTPNLRVYAMDGTELRNTMDFANRHFRQSAIRFNWNQTIPFPRQHTPVSFDIQDRLQFVMIGRQIGPFLASSGIKPLNEDNFTIRALCSFNITVVNDNARGIVSGRDICENATCDGNAVATLCNVNLETIDFEDSVVGSGVTTRNVYPNYFSKIVLSHEIGHYFGLCHFNHHGVQNIMFSLAAGNRIFDWGLFRFYLNSEPHFSYVDKKNMWRFIVEKLGDEL